MPASRSIPGLPPVAVDKEGQPEPIDQIDPIQRTEARPTAAPTTVQSASQTRQLSRTPESTPQTTDQPVSSAPADTEVTVGFSNMEISSPPSIDEGELGEPPLADDLSATPAQAARPIQRVAEPDQPALTPRPAEAGPIQRLSAPDEVEKLVAIDPTIAPSAAVPTASTNQNRPLQRRAATEQADSPLAETLLARAVARQKMPLTDLQRYTAQLEPEDDERLPIQTRKDYPALTATRLTASRPTSLFRARSIQPQTAVEAGINGPVVQRLPESESVLPLRTLPPAPVSQAEPGRIFRADTLPEAAESASPPTAQDDDAADPPNLDNLARQIYPLIKRMLAVERERRSGRR
jgi:hypothetical protein